MCEKRHFFFLGNAYEKVVISPILVWCIYAINIDNFKPTPMLDIPYTIVISMQVYRLSKNAKLCLFEV